VALLQTLGVAVGKGDSVALLQALGVAVGKGDSVALLQALGVAELHNVAVPVEEVLCEERGLALLVLEDKPSRTSAD
jgi:hypothetical protein